MYSNHICVCILIGVTWVDQYTSELIWKSFHSFTFIFWVLLLLYI